MAALWEASNGAEVDAQHLIDGVRVVVEGGSARPWAGSREGDMASGSAAAQKTLRVPFARSASAALEDALSRSPTVGLEDLLDAAADHLAAVPSDLVPLRQGAKKRELGRTPGAGGRLERARQSSAHRSGASSG